jgi:hypothetical protein
MYGDGNYETEASIITFVTGSGLVTWETAFSNGTIRCQRFRGEASPQILWPVHRHESPLSSDVQPPIPFRTEHPQSSHQRPETLPNDRTPD